MWFERICLLYLFEKWNENFYTRQNCWRILMPIRWQLGITSRYVQNASIRASVSNEINEKWINIFVFLSTFAICLANASKRAWRNCPTNITIPIGLVFGECVCVCGARWSADHHIHCSMLNASVVPVRCQFCESKVLTAHTKACRRIDWMYRFFFFLLQPQQHIRVKSRFLMCARLDEDEL